VRILTLTAAYPAPSEPGRAVYIENLTRALGRFGDGEVPTVVAPRVRPEDPLDEARRGVRVRRFRYPSGGRRLKEMRRPSPWALAAYFVSGLAVILEEIRRREPQVLLCHWVLPAGVLGATASKMLGVPLVLVAHGSDVNRYALASSAFALLARGSTRQARAVLAASEPLRRALVDRLSVPREKVSVLPMGVDDGLFPSLPAAEEDAERLRREARAALRLEPGRRTILFVGDLIPEKGVPELLAAHAALRGLDVELCLIGDGPLRGGSTGGERVRYLGRLPQQELPAWYRAADLLVLPSHSEGSPVTLMEALSLGTPVVATAVGGIPDLLREDAVGRLVPPGDVPALEKVLRELLSDPGSIARMREGIRRNPQDFSARRRAVELREVLVGLGIER